MSLSRLLDVLDRAGVEIEAGAILDALWLAHHRPEFGETRPDASVPRAPAAPAVPAAAAPPYPERGEAAAPGPMPAEHQPAPAELDPATVAAYSGGDPFGAGRRASAIATAGAAPLFDALPFQRALRPFRDRAPSRTVSVLDEDATAERSAEISHAGAMRLMPVVTPARERWFTADLVTEEDAAAEVWRDTLRAFAQTMRNSGAFRDVREWKLDLGEVGQGRAMLHAPGGAAVPAACLSGGERRLILFASHGGSAHWSSGAYQRLLAFWAKDASVALIHLLDPAAWSNTTLGEADALAVTHRPGVTNRELGVEPFWWLPPEATAGATPFPLVDLSPGGVDAWAAMLMARGGPAPVTLLSPTEPAFLPPPEEGEAMIQRRLGALLSAAPQAFQLAVLLSDAPFTVPVARLIQEAHFGRSDHQALARLFTSGLLRLRPGQLRFAQSPWFLIHPAAAATLRRSLRPGDAEAVAKSVIQRVSDHISRATGARPPLTSFVLDEHGASTLPDWARPFALVAARLTARRPADTGPRLRDMAHVTDRLTDLDPAAQAMLVRLARSNAPLNAAEIPAPAWTVLLDRTLSELDAQGERRLTRAATAILEQISEQRLLLGARIMWVDERRENSSALVRRMTEEGATVVTARSTSEAIERAGEGRDIIIIGNVARGVPTRAALALLEALRQEDIATPVILFGSHGFAADRATRAAAARAGAYFTTSDPDALLRHVRRLHRELGAAADETFESGDERSEHARYVEALHLGGYAVAPMEAGAGGFEALSDPLCLVGAQLTDFADEIDPESRRLAIGHLLLADLAVHADDQAGARSPPDGVGQRVAEVLARLGWTLKERTHSEAKIEKERDLLRAILAALPPAPSKLLLRVLEQLLAGPDRTRAGDGGGALFGSRSLFEREDDLRLILVTRREDLLRCLLITFRLRGRQEERRVLFFRATSGDARLVVEQVAVEARLDQLEPLREAVEARVRPFLDSHVATVRPS